MIKSVFSPDFQKGFVNKFVLNFYKICKNTNLLPIPFLQQLKFAFKSEVFQFSPVVHHPLARTGTSRFYWFLIPPPNYFELNNNKINILAMKCVFPTIINHIEVIPSTCHNFLILKFALQYWQLLKFFISNCRISMN